MSKTLRKKGQPVERGPYIQGGYEEALIEWTMIGTRHNQFGRKNTPESHRFLFRILLDLKAGRGNVVSVEDIVRMGKKEKKGVSDTSLVTYIRNIIKDLFDLGLMKRTRKKPRPDVRTQYVYTVIEPSQFVEKKIDPRTPPKQTDNAKSVVAAHTRKKRQLEIQEAIKADKGLLNITATNPNEPWSIVLLTQLMERCCRRSNLDDRENIESTVNLAGEEVKVVAFTVTRNDDVLGGKPGLITDQDSQVMLAIMTLAMQQVEKAREQGVRPVNRLVIDVVELCELLGKATQGASRKSVVQSLRRIIYTTWTIMPDAEKKQAREIEEKVGFKVTEMDFQLIRDVMVGIDSNDDRTNENLSTPRWFTVTLNDFVWRNLTQGIETRLLHPGILKESSSLIHKLHAHCRLHTPRTGSITRTMGELRNRFDSAMPTSAFNQKMRSVLMKKAGLPEDAEIPAKGVGLEFYGYQLTVLPDPLSKSGRIILQCRLSPEGLQILELQDQKLQKLQGRSNTLIEDQKVIDN